MDREYRPSIGFYVGIVCLTLVLGPCLLGLAAIMTWGLIFVPVIALIWLGPLLLLQWILWGRAFARQAPEPIEGVARVPGPRPTPSWGMLQVAGRILVVIGIALYYLNLFGVFDAHAEPLLLRLESASDGTTRFRLGTFER